MSKLRISVTHHTHLKPYNIVFVFTLLTSNFSQKLTTRHLPCSKYHLAPIMMMNSPASIARLSEIELSILEYARYYNLASDHLCPSIISEYIHKAQSEPSASSKVVPSDSHLPQFPPPTQISAQERFQCSKEVAELLFSLQRTNSPTSDFLTPARLDVRVTRRLKCELPLLSTDHEADLRKWLSNRRDELNPDDVLLPMEPLDDEKGESLRWPSKMWDLPEQVMSDIRREKTLDVSHEDIEYLQDIMNDEDVEDLSPWSWDGVDFYKKVSGSVREF